MPPARKPLTIELPKTVADEITDAAQRMHRSVAFIVRRALGAAPNAPAPDVSEEVVPLVCAPDEEDPADTLTKIKAYGGLSSKVAGAWLATRGRFHAWIAREEDARQAERADDLDSGLRDASAADATPTRLAELAGSEYPKIRALVAAHTATPLESLRALAADRERYVREIARANPRTPASP